MTHIQHYFGNDATIVGGITSGATTIPLIQVSTPHDLIRIAGYAKFLNRKIGNVYYRGQAELHNADIIPSLFRKRVLTRKIDDFSRKLGTFIKDWCSRSKLLEDVNELAREPLLQHYGIKTRWIDIVDNIWVALWFGMYDWKYTVTKEREYISIQRRNDFSITKGMYKDEYCFIFLIVADSKQESQDCDGLYIGKTTQVIDLRKACPSVFLRPHAQHAMLIKKTPVITINDSNINDKIVSVLRIAISDATKWIGNSELLATSTLIPSEYFDEGYRKLSETFLLKKGSFRDYGSVYKV